MTPLKHLAPTNWRPKSAGVTIWLTAWAESYEILAIDSALAFIDNLALGVCTVQRNKKYLGIRSYVCAVEIWQNILLRNFNKNTWSFVLEWAACFNSY